MPCSEKESLERRCRSLEEQISQLTSNDTIDRQMQRLQDENEKHKNTREEMENALQAERNAFDARLLERDRESARVRAELQSELDAARKRLQDMQESMSRVERSFQEQVVHSCVRALCLISQLR
eukprot:SAG31_NODE_1271_length_9064_cov_10.148912_4_plen_124_part_00